MTDQGYFLHLSLPPSSATIDVWGPNVPSPFPTSTASGFLQTTPRRYFEGAWVDESNPYSHSHLSQGPQGSPWNGGLDPGTAKEIFYPAPYHIDNQPTVSGTITRGLITNTNTSGGNPYGYANPGPTFYPTAGIVFDRVPGQNTAYVEFQDIGIANGGLNTAYNTAAGTSHPHNVIFNGDEIHVQVKITCFKTLDGGANTGQIGNQDKTYGYNYIQPVIELIEGNTGNVVDSDKFVTSLGTSTTNQALHTLEDKPYEYTQITTDVLDYSYYGLNLPSGYIDGNTGYNIGTAAYGPPTITGTSSSLSDLAASVKHWQSTATYTAPSTRAGSNYQYNTGLPNSIFQGTGPTGSYTPESLTIIVGASWKFRDDAQQNADGSPIVSSDNITEAIAVNNLRIRVRNIEPEGSSGIWGSTPNPTDQDMQYPLWIIDGVKAVKGFGITNPSADAIVGDVITTSQITTPPVTGQNAITALSPVPPENVPGWTEVTHHWFDEWSFNQDPYTSNSMLTNVYAAANLYPVVGFGNNYSAVTQTGLLADPLDASTFAALSPTSINYVVPQDWQHLASPGSPPSEGTPWFHTDNNSGGIVYPNIGYDNPTIVPVTDSSVTVQHPGGTDNFHLTQDISHDPWVAGTWYLVDVEIDENYNANAGQDGDDGAFIVEGVASVNNYQWTQEIDPEGVGIYRGEFFGGHGCQLVPDVRTEYGNADGSGDNKNVLRGIFQFASDAPRNANQALRDKFVLWVYKAVNAVRITKIIVKKLDYVQTTGSAHLWWRNHNSVSITPAHAFSDRKLYWKGSENNTPYNMLCWNVPTNNQDLHGLKWTQGFNTANTQIVPDVTPYGWRLNFTVSNNPDTDDFAGTLRGFVTRDATGDVNSPTYPSPNGMEGLYFQGIDAVGHYQIKFNMDGDDSSWTAEHSVDGTTWTDVTGAPIGLSPVSALSSTFSESNRITFMPGATTGDANDPHGATRYAVGDVLLTDETVVFQGGSAGSWNFDGFDSTAERWIHWAVPNENATPPHGGRLTFENAPRFDPNGSQNYYINANQWIDKPIKEFEQYVVQFEANLTSGDLRIYYFNSDGKGFVWNPNFDGHYGSTETYGGFPAQTIGSATYGDPSSYSSQDLGDNILKETLVIQVKAPNDLTTGWIDNISMTQVYSPSGEIPKTITFSEDVNGWTSFKSFIPESGVTLSKKYFTMKDGGLWKHYVPMLADPIGNYQTEMTDPNSPSGVMYVMPVTVEHADNYNTFYNTYYPSKIKTVLNAEPSTVKTFNTLNYEGSQAYVKQHSDGASINTSNAKAFLDGDISGWECTEIKTDMDAGSVNDFIKKEGKWFNYIKGKTLPLSNASWINTSRFSVQGIGKASSVTPTTSNGNGNGSNGNGGGGNGGGGNGGGGNGGGGGGNGSGTY